jgi:hypothetical protein
VVHVLVALSLLAVPGDASVYFEQNTTILGAGDEDGESSPGVASKVWYDGRRMRLEAGGAPGGHALILRLDEGRAYRLDPSTRTATEIDLERLRARSQEDASTAADLMGVTEEGPVRVARLPGRTIAGQACDGYRLSTGTTVMEVYLAAGLPVGVEAFTDFLDWSGASASMTGLLAELRKLRGFPMQTRSRVTILDEVHETVSTVTRVKVGPLPAGLFDPPDGYEIRKEAAANPR